MAQPGNYTPILLYGSSTPTNVPLAANLTNNTTGSEIAINVADKNLFFKDNTNTVNTVPIRQSSTSSDGWLSSTDWNTFNNKAPAGAYLTAVTADSPLSGAGTSASHLVIAQANTSTSGYLSSTDWNTFNGKAPGVTFTTGYVPFGQGSTTLGQDAGLFWDNTNKRLGVGTIAPTAKFEISQNTTTGAGAAGVAVNIIGADAAATNIYSSSYGAGNQLVFRSTGGTAATPTATPTATSLFRILGLGYSGSAFTGSRVQINATTSEAWSATAQGTILTFATTPNGTTAVAEAMRIFGSSGVSIGNTTDPGSTALNVVGTLSVGINTPVASYGTLPGAVIGGTGGTTGNALTVLSTSATAANSPRVVFYHAGQDTSSITGGAGFTFLQGTTEYARFNYGGGLSIGTTTNCSTGNLLVNKSVGLGNVTLSGSGVGVQFPATQSASSDVNTLDDYEEGTWTPTANNISFSAATGKYTKIGNLVTVTFSVTFPATADTNNAQVASLPFNIGFASAVAINGNITLTQLSPNVGANSLSFITPNNAAYSTNANLSGQGYTGCISYQV